MDGEKRKKLGKRGEELAIGFLEDRGYCIIERNFRCRLGELDIIAKEDNQIVFIEVKTRMSTTFGLPQESLHYSKKKRLTRLASLYLANHHLQKASCRFDVIAITVKGERVHAIDLIKNAFEATV